MLNLLKILEKKLNLSNVIETKTMLYRKIDYFSI